MPQALFRYLEYPFPISPHDCNALSIAGNDRKHVTHQNRLHDVSAQDSIRLSAHQTDWREAMTKKEELIAQTIIFIIATPVFMGLLCLPFIFVMTLVGGSKFF